MLLEVRNKIYLRVIEQYPNEKATYYQGLLNLPEIEQFKHDLITLTEENWLENNDQSFRVTNKGMEYLEDSQDNLSLLLRTIKTEGIGNGHQKLLPYLTDRDYGKLFNDAVTKGLISAKNEKEIITPTPLGMMVSPSTYVTELGDVFIQKTINK